MDFLLLAAIGMVMGLFGGLLGIGGSIIMIPAMIIFFKPNQHLYQAAAMICNFFVAGSAVLVHRKNKILVVDTVKWLIPAAVAGILAGVWFSNISFFAEQKSTNLTKVFALFLVYVAVYNIFKSTKHDGGIDGLDISHTNNSGPFTFLSGLFTGFSGGLLGTGGGTVCTPMQQLCLKMPIKRAIANSSAVTASMALIGALYKNLTLARHNIEIIDSLKIAVVVIPTAMLGSFFGSRLMHKLPKNIVRAVFIVLLIAAAVKMLTV